MRAPQEPNHNNLVIGFHKPTGDIVHFATYQKTTKKGKHWYVIGIETTMTWPALYKWATRQKIILIEIPTLKEAQWPKRKQNRSPGQASQ